MKCNAKGYPVPVLTWKKDNEVIGSTSETFEITNMQFNQSGRYECWAENQHGVDAKAFYITLTGTFKNDLKFTTHV